MIQLRQFDNLTNYREAGNCLEKKESYSVVVEGEDCVWMDGDGSIWSKDGNGSIWSKDGNGSIWSKDGNGSIWSKAG